MTIDPERTQAWLERFQGIAAEQELLLVQIARSVVQHDNPQDSYVTVQVDRKLWNDLRRYERRG